MSVLVNWAENNPVTNSLAQFDYGQSLQIYGSDLPFTFKAVFTKFNHVICPVSN